MLYCGKGVNIPLAQKANLHPLRTPYIGLHLQYVNGDAIFSTMLNVPNIQG